MADELFYKEWGRCLTCEFFDGNNKCKHPKNEGILVRSRICTCPRIVPNDVYEYTLCVNERMKEIVIYTDEGDYDEESLAEAYFTKEKIDELKQQLIKQILESENPFSINCTDEDGGYLVVDEDIWRGHKPKNMENKYEIGDTVLIKYSDGTKSKPYTIQEITKDGGYIMDTWNGRAYLEEVLEPYVEEVDLKKVLKGLEGECFYLKGVGEVIFKGIKDILGKEHVLLSSPRENYLLRTDGKWFEDDPKLALYPSNKQRVWADLVKAV